jgi:acetyl esterase/lipase
MERSAEPDRAPVNDPSKVNNMRRLMVLVLAILTGAPAQAQQVPAAAASMFVRVAPPPQPPGAVPLYPGAAPESRIGTVTEIWDRMPDGHPVLRNITRPTITPFLPAADKATGAAVIVIPGGGFQILSMESEGWTIAQWLADHGVAAFVLKYRLNKTPDDEKALLPTLAKSMGALMSAPEATMAPMEPPALADILQALKRVRSDSAKWQINPARVGLIGFSAGAMASRDAALTPDAASRPSYFGYIYGPMVAVSVPTDAPPMFAALALDDPLFGREGFGIVEAWRKAGQPVELHAYEKGSHGFGAGKPGTTSILVLPEFLAWMNARGLLNPHT